MIAQNSHTPSPPEVKEREKESVLLSRKFALLVKRESFCFEMFPQKKPYMKKKPRNRKTPQKHSVNQFDFDESEEEILSVSCAEEEITAQTTSWPL